MLSPAAKCPARNAKAMDGGTGRRGAALTSLEYRAQAQPVRNDMRKDTTRLRLLPAVAAVLIADSGSIQAQTSDLPPERAPAAQQNAPPARIAPPMNAGAQKPGANKPGTMPETTGQRPQRLSPGSGDPARLAPSSDDASDAHGNNVHAGRQ